jgi:hypothetical protein
MKPWMFLPFFLLPFQCGKIRPISADQYARFAAKKAFIIDHCRNMPDSLGPYLAGLYKSEALNPEKVQDFVDQANKYPEQWIEIQQKIVAEIEKLNPRRPNTPPFKR